MLLSQQKICYWCWNVSTNQTPAQQTRYNLSIVDRRGHYLYFLQRTPSSRSLTLALKSFFLFSLLMVLSSNWCLCCAKFNLFSFSPSTSSRLNFAILLFASIIWIHWNGLRTSTWRFPSNFAGTLVFYEELDVSARPYHISIMHFVSFFQPTFQTFSDLTIFRVSCSFIV